jgi:hypothetical protein
VGRAESEKLDSKKRFQMNPSSKVDKKQDKRDRACAADRRRYTKCRQSHKDLDETGIVQLITGRTGKIRLNFEELKRCGHFLCNLANLQQPGREEQRRRELFVGWLNDHQPELQPFLSYLDTRSALSEPPRSKNSSVTTGAAVVLTEDDRLFKDIYDWAF